MIGASDPRIATADPGVAIGGFPEDVQAPPVGGWLSHPGLMVLFIEIASRVEGIDEAVARSTHGNIELEAGEHGCELTEPVMRDRHLKILVYPSLHTEKEVNGPATGDVPGCLDRVPAGHFYRHLDVIFYLSFVR